MGGYESVIQKKTIEDNPSGFRCDELHPVLFDFQAVLVRWALSRGRAAIFADTGLGKTFMQVEWAKRVCEHTGGNVLIVAPLCVAQQTVNEAKKIAGFVHYCRSSAQANRGINITNYEMLDHFDLSQFDGVVLDESSILKSHTGKTRTALIEQCQAVPYRLSCTATPSPNDFMELGNQAEFLGVMSRTEMLAMFFTHDGGETSKWRLKGWGKTRFWEWMSQWAAVIRKPSDLGFDDSRYDLPPLNINEHVIADDFREEGQLFTTIALTLSERRRAQRQSIDERVAAVAEIVNNSDEQWIVWCHLNDESTALAKAIPDAVDVKGSDSIDKKEQRIMDFTEGRQRVLVSKPSITGYGMNWQHCHKQAFVGLSDSFEQFYQAVRRCWRFGQELPVDVEVFTAESEGQVLANIKRKELLHHEMSDQMVDHMKELMQEKITQTGREVAVYERDYAEGDGWQLHQADCVHLASEMETESIDYTLFSPPFASLYTYSNSDYDMGNCKSDDDFYKQFKYLVDEMFRITKPGRLLSFHCMNLPTSKQNHGYIGIRDFRGLLIKLFQDAGWIFHSEVCIWKDPVVAMQRTKALGLLWKQVRKDAAMSRQGIPDYLVTMRKPGLNPNPVTHSEDNLPVALWQKYASPVWMDINPSRTLNKMPARDDNDERHICPLQLDVIERALHLWTNPDDLVFSPFTGIGSEGYCALQMNRRFIGAELKPSYFQIAKENLDDVASGTMDLFASA
ncbi:MAG: helicase [Epsilonproteobacteria bacterium]|nr:MAG: helicase [Campylobacterota bacterium]